MDRKEISEASIQYRQIAFTKLETRSNAGGELIVEGYAATFNQPYVLYSADGYTVREQISPRAFDGCDMSDVLLQYDHKGKIYARTTNGTLRVWTDAHGLKMWANLSGTEAGRQLYDEIKGGYVTKMSFGFHVGEDKRDVKENKLAGTVDVLRTILSIDKLFDVSAVSIPANSATEISARGYCESVIAELVAARRKREEDERQKRKIRIMTQL